MDNHRFHSYLQTNWFHMLPFHRYCLNRVYTLQCLKSSKFHNKTMHTTFGFDF